MTDTLTTSSVGSADKRPSALVVSSVVLLGMIAVIAVVGRWIAPHDADDQDPLFGVTAPSSTHWLGTDELGRDILSRLMAGAANALIGPACVAVGTTLIAMTLGLMAGYYGGRIDGLISRVADLMYSLPSLLIAIVMVGLVSGSYWLTVAVLIFLMFPSGVRVCRSASLVQARLPYVDAARTLGLSDAAVMGRHILPNIAPTVLATMLLDFVGALVGFAALAFLGMGVEPGGVDWGTILADGQKQIFANPAMSLAPAVLLVIVAAGATIVGDWVYDRRSLKDTGR